MELAKASGKITGYEIGSYEEEEGSLKFGVHYTTEISNINQDFDIVFPELNENNSLDIAKKMKQELALDRARYEMDRDQIKVLVDYVPVAYTTDPQIINGRVMVPVRETFKALGAEIGWDPATKTATANNGDIDIVLKVDSDVAIVNGNDVTLDVPATVVGGRTLVPLRFVSESLGAEVEWDSYYGLLKLQVQNRS